MLEYTKIFPTTTGNTLHYPLFLVFRRVEEVLSKLESPDSESLGVSDSDSQFPAAWVIF
jgi:hypothetical protein